MGKPPHHRPAGPDLIAGGGRRLRHLSTAPIADQIESTGAILADPNIHRLTKAVGLATDLTSLQHRRRVSDEVQPAGPCPETDDPTPFNGRYTGLLKRRLASGQSEWLPGRADFQRSGNRVRGRFSFGAGEGIIQGTVVKGARLIYDWQWSTAAGRGVLEYTGDTGLQGDWQYADGTVGGAWALCPPVGP